MRLIAATNRDLEREIAAGGFRGDLFFRLSVFRIQLPPLAERRGDIPEYVRFFATQFAAKMGNASTRSTTATSRPLERHPWPGNVRELRNVVERSMIMADGNSLTFLTASPPSFTRRSSAVRPDSLTLEDLERRHILRVLDHTGGNKAEAARLLGIGIATLYRKLESYGVK